MPDLAGPDLSGNAKWDRSFFGHPRGLSTLFFTEMWERFSYYGMRALLILFMTASLRKGGLGFPASKAGAIYGLYTALVYLVSLPGGWIADRIAGPRRAVLVGGIVIAAGHFSMAIPRIDTFYFGLALIVIGTGLLKPNISTMVGALYPPEDVRRDAGFSIFYMGINIGAMISPVVCGYLAEKVNWHYGFGAAGVGMTLGLVQYVLGGRYMGAAGLSNSGTAEDRRQFKRWLIAAVAFIAILAAASLSGALSFSAEQISTAFGILLIAIVIAFFFWLFNAKGYTVVERRRFWVILILFLGSAMFWSAYEQAGSTLNLFAERNTDLHAWDSSLWGDFLPEYFQSLNSVFIIALAPVFAWIWIALRRHEPSSAAKFSLGLVFVGLGFAVLIPVAAGKALSPWWLTVTYLLHTVGELCLSPVGLSAMTKLAPARIAGLVMGVWFLSISVGDYIGGRLAAVYETFPLPELFALVAAFCILVAAFLVALFKPVKHLSGGIQ